jgi:hypothetical protein
MVVSMLCRRWRVVAVPRIRGHSRSDGTAQCAAYDGSIATPDFVAYGRASRASDAPTDGCIEGRVPCIRRSSEQGY